MNDSFAVLPGADLVAPGLRDLGLGLETVPALLVAIGAPRLRRLGLEIPPARELPPDPELRLYRLLCREEGGGAYSRYNALPRKLISFERALEGCLARQRRRNTPGATEF